MTYKVSVIIPVYNVEKFMRKCLDSVVNQTLKEIEIVAVNDCSTDSSLEILKEYQYKYGDMFQIIDSRVNQKQGGARNLGIAAARGEYIGFVDPDDYISKEMFEKMYSAAKENNADVVTCDYYEVIGCNEVYKRNDLPEGELDNEKLREVLRRKYGWELWQQLYRRDLFIKNKIEFSPHLYVTDLEIGALIIMYARRIAKVREGLYFYVKHDSATTSFKLNDKKVYDLITVSNKRLEHFKERKLYNDFKDEIDYIYFWHVCVVSVSRCVLNFSKPQYEKLEEIKMELNINIPNIRNNEYFKKSSLYCKIIYFMLYKNKYFLVGLLQIPKMISPTIKEGLKNLINR